MKIIQFPQFDCAELWRLHFYISCDKFYLFTDQSLLVILPFPYVMLNIISHI